MNRSSKDFGCSRRYFLRIAGASSLQGVILACGSSGASADKFGDVAAGNVADLAVDSLQVVSGAPAILGRDAAGVYAMTSTCTHAGCNMIDRGAVTNTGVDCFCHGSRFDANGNPTSGPANAQLEHFAVTIDASGNMTVHGGSPVDGSVRTAVA